MNINSQSPIDNERLTNQKLESPETAGYQTLFNSSNVLFGDFLLYIYVLYMQEIDWRLEEISFKMYAVTFQERMTRCKTKIRRTS